MSHFTVLVIGDNPEEQLKPFQENNMGDCPKEYLAFHDTEDDYRKEYEEDGVEMVRCPDGSLAYTWDDRFKVYGESPFDTKNVIPEGQGYKKVTVPHKQRFATFEDFIKDWAGYDARDPEKGRYGYWENREKYKLIICGGNDGREVLPCMQRNEASFRILHDSKNGQESSEDAPLLLMQRMCSKGELKEENKRKEIQVAHKREIRDICKTTSRDDRESKRLMRDMQRAAGEVSCGPLPQDWGSSCPALQKMQHDDRVCTGRCEHTQCSDKIPHTAHVVARLLIGGSKWDWYSLGGRWNGFFKLKPGAKGTAGDAAFMGDPARPGWADQARKKDIDFDAMVEDAVKRAEKAWEDAEKEAPNEGPMRYFKFGIDKDVTREQHIENARKNACTTFAVLKDGVWYERGEMGWWGCVSNEKKGCNWRDEFMALFDEIGDDELLSIFDCHI